MCSVYARIAKGPAGPRWLLSCSDQACSRLLRRAAEAFLRLNTAAVQRVTDDPETTKRPIHASPQPPSVNDGRERANNHYRRQHADNPDLEEYLPQADSNYDRLLTKRGRSRTRTSRTYSTRLIADSSRGEHTRQTEG